MAEPAAALPAFVSAITGQGEKALDVLQRQHPDYSARSGSWEVLLDAFEGSGGFLDGSYLWPYPREDRGNSEFGFGARMAMARYHNYLEALVDLYVRFIWTQGVKRTSENQDYNDWTEDVDGAKTPLDELLKRVLSIALVHGHAGLLIDKTPDEPVGPTKADDTGHVIANVFPALSIPDWRFKNNTLEAVKLYEAPPPVGIADELPEGEDGIQYLVWDETGWARFNGKGEFVSGRLTNLGMVPLPVLRPKPMPRTGSMLGRALVPNANVIRALYNRASEEDEVLRTQAFSTLVASVPPDGDVEQAKTDLGTSIGTSKAIVARADLKYITPDQAVAQNIRDNQQYLIQEIYRAAHIRYKRDSIQAESGESIRLQHSELNETLQGIAKALAQFEREIAKCWAAWNSSSPEAADALFESMQVEATYPTEFFLDDLMVDLEAWAEAVRMNLGPTMTKRIKKAAVQRIDPNIPQEELEKINAEIDGQKDEELQNTPVMPALDNGDPEGQAISQADGFA